MEYGPSAEGTLRLPSLATSDPATIAQFLQERMERNEVIEVVESSEEEEVIETSPPLKKRKRSQSPPADQIEVVSDSEPSDDIVEITPKRTKR